MNTLTTPDGVQLQFESLGEYSTLEQVNEHMSRYRSHIKNAMGPPDVNQLHDPFLLYGMQRAHQRIRQALDVGEKILLLGDYDVDGICGTAILYKSICDHDGSTHYGKRRLYYHIPDRFIHGYGLQEKYINLIASQGVQLVITIDNGMGARGAVAGLAEKGIDTIIFDHHLPSQSGGLMNAYATVNQKQMDCTYPNKYLCGAGLATKAVQALYGTEAVLQYIDYTALATVADVVELLGENRRMVQLGVQKMRTNPHLAIKALFDIRNQNHRTATSESLAFWLAPLINASNRIPREPGTPNPAVQLLIEDDPGMSVELLQLLHERRFIQERNERLIHTTCALQQNQKMNIITAHNGEYNQGVAGLIASTAMQQTGKPSLALSKIDAHTYTGSGRCTPKYHLKEGLDRCSKYVLKYGGHKMAAGFSIESKNIDAFTAAMFQDARKHLQRYNLAPELDIDFTLSRDTLCMFTESEKQQFIQILNTYGPYGMANQAPSIYVPRVRLMGLENVGPLGRHVQLNTDIGYTMSFFKGLPHSKNLEVGAWYNLVVQPSVQGNTIDLLTQHMHKSKKQGYDLY